MKYFALVFLCFLAKNVISFEVTIEEWNELKVQIQELNTKIETLTKQQDPVEDRLDKLDSLTKVYGNSMVL